MKRIQAACICQTLHCMLKEDIPHDEAVALVGHEVGVAVLGDEASEALAHIQQPELRPQVHEAVGARRAGQADDPLDRGSDTK